MNPSGPRKYRKIAPDCGCRRAHLDLDVALDQEVPVPEHVVDGLHLEVHMAEARSSPWKTASLWCTGSIRIRQAASPSQSQTRALKRVLQNW